MLTGLALTLLPTTVRAQQAKPQAITFETFDKAELQGDWYASAKTIKAPTALLVHKIGSDRKALAPLAEKLQEAGYAVLTFDLRGHGESTTVNPVAFWGVQANVNGIRQPSGNKKTIDYKTFLTSYYPFLINDLAAAKYYLEKQNNARECNVNDLVVVGADDGATLTALWLYTEWDRRRIAINAMGFAVPGDPQGKDIAAAVFLSLRPALGSGNKSVNVDGALTNAFNGAHIKDAQAKQDLREKTGYCFIYGKDDSNAATEADKVYGRVLAAEKNKLPLTYRVALKTKLAGANLLANPDLETEDLVVKYLEQRVMKARKNTVWEERKKLEDYPIAEVPIRNYGISP